MKRLSVGMGLRKLTAPPIDYDLNDADYKIICYIDSASCTSRRMKMRVWNSVLNELMSCDDAELSEGLEGVGK